MLWHRPFFLLLLLFFPTQLGFHFWPDWALVLGRRVDYLSPTLYATDLLVLCTVGSYIIFNFKFSIFNKFSKFFVIFLLFAAINIFVAENQMVALYKWIKVTEFLLLGWYIVRTKPKLSAIIFPLSIGILYSSVLAIAQFFLQHSVGGVLWWLGERMFTIDTPGIARIDWYGRELLRPYATFPHPNVLGGYIAAILPLIVVSAGQRVSGSAKNNLFILFFVGIIALLLTFSRSAIVVGILALVLVFFQKKKILFFLAILFLTFSFFLFPFSFFEESVVVRQQLNVAAIKLWQSSPLFGVGLGNFLVRLPEALPTRTIYFLQPVHNIYLLLLSEIGAVGVAGVVGVVWVAIRKKKRILFVPLIAYLLLGFVDHYPLTLQQGQLLLTVLAARAVLSVH